MGHLKAILALLGASLGPCWSQSGPQQVVILTGRQNDHPKAPILAPSCGHFWAVWGPRQPAENREKTDVLRYLFLGSCSDGFLPVCRGVSELILGYLGPSWPMLESSLLSWAILGYFGDCLRCLTILGRICAFWTISTPFGNLKAFLKPSRGHREAMGNIL